MREEGPKALEIEGLKKDEKGGERLGIRDKLKKITLL
jgi:hypothetical protein